MLKAATLRPKDVIVACKLFSYEDHPPKEGWTFASLAADLGIAASEVHGSVERCRQAQLLVAVRSREIVSKRHFHELLSIAAPRIFFATRGSITQGMPTGVYARPLESSMGEIRRDALPVVWIGSEGDIRGEGIAPIHPSAPEVARKDPLVYELLALVDVVRVGDTQSRNRAIALLERKIVGKIVE